MAMPSSHNTEKILRKYKQKYRNTERLVRARNAKEVCAAAAAATSEKLAAFSSFLPVFASVNRLLTAFT